MWRRLPGQAPDPLTKRQRWSSTLVSVAVGLVVLAATQNLFWGVLAFVLLSVAVNIGVYLLRDRWRRSP